MTEDSSNVVPVYGFALSKAKQSELRAKTQEKFSIPSTQYMRMVVDAILEDRLIIKKPKHKHGVYS